VIDWLVRGRGDPNMRSVSIGGCKLDTVGGDDPAALPSDFAKASDAHTAPCPLLPCSGWPLLLMPLLLMPLLRDALFWLSVPFFLK
jgi:hypothetical protein